MLKIPAPFSRNGSILANLLFSGYLFFLNERVYGYFFNDTISETSRKVIYDGEISPFLGIVLLLVIAGELIAYYLKMKSSGIKSESPGLFFLWMFHSVIAVIMSISAMLSFGVTFERHTGIMSSVLFGTVIKELFILMIIMAGDSKGNGSMKAGLAADFLFAVFYSVTYTVVIGNILGPGNYDNYLQASWQNMGMLILNAVLILILFLMLYMPLLLPFFLTEKRDSMLKNAIFYLSLVLVAAGVLFPFFEGEHSLDEALKKPQKTKMLFLNNSGITELPPDIGRLTELRVLHLGGNMLQSLPSELERCSSLNWINLKGNRLSEFPVPLTRYASLNEVDIRNNRIKRFPENLSLLIKIKKIRAGGNGISAGEKNRIIHILGKDKVDFK